MWGGSRSVSGGIRPVVLLTFDEPGDCRFSFLCFSVICLLSSTRVLKAGTCMLHVYTLPKKCQPGLMTMLQRLYRCIAILQNSLPAQIPLVRVTPGIEGGGWGRRESTGTKLCPPQLAKESKLKITHALGLYIRFLTHNLHAALVWAGHDPVTEKDLWQWTPSPWPPGTFPTTGGFLLPGSSPSFSLPPFCFPWSLLLYGSPSFWATLLSRTPRPTFHNLNSSCAKAQYVISLLIGVSAPHLFITWRIQDMLLLVSPRTDNQPAPVAGFCLSVQNLIWGHSPTHTYTQLSAAC